MGAEIIIGQVYRNETAGFDICAVPNPDYRGGTGHRFLVLWRHNEHSEWEPPLHLAGDSVSARAAVAKYLTHPSLPG